MYKLNITRVPWVYTPKITEIEFAHINIPMNIYTITYNGNGNTYGTAPASTSCYEGETTTIPGRKNLAKSCYTFLGWNTKADGSGVRCSVFNMFNMGASNLILYAEWGEGGECGTNIALNKSATAPSSFLAMFNGEPPVVVDGDEDTSWNAGASDTWIIIDLAATLSFNKIRIKAQFADDIDVYGSNDGVNYTSIVQDFNVDTNWQEQSFSPVSYRYVRFDYYDGGWFGLYEVEIY